MRSWLIGTRLVAERGPVENIRSRSFKIVTVILLLLSVAAVTLPQIIGKDSTTYTLATEGAAPADVVAALDAAGTAGGFTRGVPAADRRRCRAAGGARRRRDDGPGRTSSSRRAMREAHSRYSSPRRWCPLRRRDGWSPPGA